jgi:hypothetical protein
MPGLRGFTYIVYLCADSGLKLHLLKIEYLLS